MLLSRVKQRETSLPPPRVYMSQLNGDSNLVDQALIGSVDQGDQAITGRYAREGSVGLWALLPSGTTAETRYYLWDPVTGIV